MKSCVALRRLVLSFLIALPFLFFAVRGHALTMIMPDPVDAPLVFRGIVTSQKTIWQKLDLDWIIGRQEVPFKITRVYKGKPSPLEWLKCGQFHRGREYIVAVFPDSRYFRCMEVMDLTRVQGSGYISAQNIGQVFRLEKIRAHSQAQDAAQAFDLMISSIDDFSALFKSPPVKRAIESAKAKLLDENERFSEAQEVYERVIANHRAELKEIFEDEARGGQAGETVTFDEPGCETAMKNPPVIFRPFRDNAYPRYDWDIVFNYGDSLYRSGLYASSFVPLCLASNAPNSSSGNRANRILVQAYAKMKKESNTP